MTTILDRLIRVNDIAYRFEAMMYFQLSWRDARARSARDNATQAALDPAYNNGNGEEGLQPVWPPSASGGGQEPAPLSVALQMPG